MDKVTISNAQGENGLVNVVRYFNNNGTEILIYSLNEVDESGYTRLYVTKINGVDGMYTADTLNDNEWNEIKNLIKMIVKANKEGIPVPVQDLNPNKIKNILLKDKKVFKLNAPLVNDLSANKTNFGDDDQSAGNTAQPAFEIPGASAFETPVQPTFEVPSAPAFETPAQPTFEVPSAPAFETPAQPTFEVPSTPAFETPAQPTFEVPSAPAFETPAQPTFEVPSTPAFETPAQPTFEVPSAPAFETPSMPTFEVPSAPTFDFNTSVNTPVENVASTASIEDYKAKYEEELSKNQELEKQINAYKEMINNIKSTLGNE